MTWEGWYTLAVVALVFGALIKNLGPPDAVLVGGTVLVAAAGIVDPAEAFSGFVNPGVLTIAALYVVAAGMRETGALDLVGARLFQKAKTESGVLLRMALPVTGMSAFLNNTPVVAMLMPVLNDWCRAHRVSPSRVLMPLSFMAILGGTCTLIGTSTNLVVSGLLEEAAGRYPALSGQLQPLRLFELTPVGLPFAVVGVVYLLTVGRRLLPDRRDLVEQLDSSSREYLVNMAIQHGCRLIGQRVEEAGLRHLPGLFLIEVDRGEQVVAPVAPDLVLEEGDILTFTGVVGTIVSLERIAGLVPVADEGYEARARERRYRTLSEAVISSTSPLIGKSIRASDFRAAYNAAVVAVHRGGERLTGRVGDIVLQSGDTLLLQTGPHFARAFRNNPDFFLVSGIQEARHARHERVVVSIILLGLLIVLMTSGVVSTVVAAFLVAGLLVATRCISAAVARQSVDWQTLITIGAAFGLGKALERSGCAAVLAGPLSDAAAPLGPYVILAGLYILTRVLTEMITNRAAVVLMFPFAIELAVQLGVSPRPFVMATTFAAAATFVTPLGYNTNLMVYGPGGYRLGDFVRVGLPLDVALTTLGIVLVPIVWPF